MAVFYFKYRGDLVGVNKWKDCRIVQNPKWKPGMNIWKRFMPSMYTSTVYKNYRKSLENALKGVRLEGYYDVRLKVSMWRRKDSDAPVKAIFDALEKSEVLSNDNRIRDFHVERAYHPKNEPDILIVEIFKPRYRETPWAGEKQISLFD